jgi:hypothetical protein
VKFEPRWKKGNLEDENRVQIRPDLGNRFEDGGTLKKDFRISNPDFLEDLRVA